MPGGGPGVLLLVLFTGSGSYFLPPESWGSGQSWGPSAPVASPIHPSQHSQARAVALRPRALPGALVVSSFAPGSGALSLPSSSGLRGPQARGFSLVLAGVGPHGGSPSQPDSHSSSPQALVRTFCLRPGLLLLLSAVLPPAPSSGPPARPPHSGPSGLLKTLYPRAGATQDKEHRRDKQSESRKPVQENGLSSAGAEGAKAPSKGSGDAAPQEVPPGRSAPRPAPSLGISSAS